MPNYSLEDLGRMLEKVPQEFRKIPKDSRRIPVGFPKACRQTDRQTDSTSSFFLIPVANSLKSFCVSLPAATMPRKQLGACQVYIDVPDFFQGAQAASTERHSVLAGDMKWESLSSKQLTLLMQNGRPWVRRSCVKSVKAYHKLSRQEQRRVLYDAGLYQYTGLGDATASNPADDLDDSDQGSMPDWGTGSEASCDEDTGAAPLWTALDLPEDGANRRLRRKAVDGFRRGSGRP